MNIYIYEVSSFLTQAASPQLALFFLGILNTIYMVNSCYFVIYSVIGNLRSCSNK